MAHSQAVDKPAVIVRTVDNLLSAGDSRIEQGPQESPAKRYIMGDAVDALGILPTLPWKILLLAATDLLTSTMALQSRLERR